MQKIIGLVGYKNSGKDTIAQHLVNEYGYIQLSYASKLKDIISILFGWSREMLEGNTPDSRLWRETVDPWWSEKLGVSSFTPRKAMVLVATNALRDHFHEDIWVLALERELIKHQNSNIVISDCRFPNEIDVIKKANGKMIRVDRQNRPVWEDIGKQAAQGNVSKFAEIQNDYDIHPSEFMWLATTPDACVRNTGTIEDLRHVVDRLDWL